MYVSFMQYQPCPLQFYEFQQLDTSLVYPVLLLLRLFHYFRFSVFQTFYVQYVQ